MSGQPTGGSGIDNANSVKQTNDNGYIVAGYSSSSDGDVGSNNGGYDFWLVKLTSAGVLDWEANFGGNENDFPNSVQQTNDGGYIIAGGSQSSDGDVGGNNGSYDMWIVKLSATGILEWETNLGGSSWDTANSIVQTSDGGYILGGGSSSTDGDVGGNNGESDFWIVKLTASGTIDWETNFGGSYEETAYSIQQTLDGGYIVAGTSSSSDGDVGGNYGSYDYWIVKISVTGTLEWEKNLGGSNDDEPNTIKQTADGSYIVGGYSLSSDYDVPSNYHDYSSNPTFDYWIVKIGPNGDIQE
ncbi:MAG: hypothetical protein R2764_22445 [Bacteroidales bacterium]